MSQVRRRHRPRRTSHSFKHLDPIRVTAEGYTSHVLKQPEGGWRVNGTTVFAQCDMQGHFIGLDDHHVLGEGFVIVALKVNGNKTVDVFLHKDSIEPLV